MSSALDEMLETTELLAATFARPESESAVLLALDIGSSGVRAALFDENAAELTRAVRNIRRSVHTNTIYADLLLDVVTDVVDELLSPVPTHVRIELFAISCFWHSLVGVDADGSPTTAVLDWTDTRAANVAQELRARFSETNVHARTGCRLHPSYWPAKLLWLRTNHQPQFAKTKHWLSFSDYVARELFDNATTSVCMASGTGLLNQKSCEWDQSLLKDLKIPIEHLPEISSKTITDVQLKLDYASRWPQLRDACLCPAIGDGAANSIGSGCTTSDKIALMVGTSGAVRVMFEGEPPRRVPAELWCYRVDRRRVILGGALSDGGGLFERLRSMLLPEMDPDELADELSRMEADAHGLTVLPMWAGERSSGWAPNASGGILGLTMKTSPIEILRASMEAIACRLALIVKSLNSFAPNAQVIASGNALQSSPVWLQIITDVLGREITLSAAREASTRGAALLALEAMGKIQLNANSSGESRKVFQPDPSQHQKYQAAIGRQQKFYEALAPSFRAV